MATPEHQPSAPHETALNEATEAEQQHFRTIAVRVEEDLHAQLRFIAQLSKTSISDEIRQAIVGRISTAQNDPELIARAQAAREQIEREAAARSAALAGFIGSTATEAPSTTTTPRTRRAHKPGSE